MLHALRLKRIHPTTDGVVVYLAAQRSFNPHGVGSSPSDPTLTGALLRR